MILRPIAIASCLALLAGCATPVTTPVEVTRFTAPSAARLGSGTITVRTPGGDGGAGLESSLYEQAVAGELARLGYQVVASGPAAQVAELQVQRSQLDPGGRRGPVSVGVGGSTGSYGSGIGVGVGVDLSPPPKPLVQTRLAVTIRDNGDARPLWEGRSEFRASSDSAFAGQQAAAQRLAGALFTGFPGASGQTITVR